MRGACEHDVRCLTPLCLCNAGWPQASECLEMSALLDAAVPSLAPLWSALLSREKQIAVVWYAEDSYQPIMSGQTD